MDTHALEELRRRFATQAQPEPQKPEKTKAKGKRTRPPRAPKASKAVKTVQLCHRVTPDLKRTLQVHCQAVGMSMNAFIEAAILAALANVPST